MKQITRNDIITLVLHIIVWGTIVLLPPTAKGISEGSWEGFSSYLSVWWQMIFLDIFLYFINFYVLVPFFFEKKYGKLVFLGINIALLRMSNSWMLQFNPEQIAGSKERSYYITAGLSLFLAINVISIAAAVFVRYMIKYNEDKKKMRELKQQSIEAELTWLKSQLNPHFLFNTMNNISSLIQIDPDQAQDSIGELSDLMRYAMYETNKPKVALKGEIEFLENYISLMKLRCNEKTTVHFDCHIDDDAKSIEIAPLLFISPIENAFKHGVSASKLSTINIGLNISKEQISFSCINTNYPKNDQNRSGSGIGIDNLQRRLELIYPGQFKYTHGVEGDMFNVKITIKL